MESSFPWLMMEWVSLPSPESCRMSVMSLRRAGAPLMRYSDSPERYILRVTASSEKSSGMVWSALSRTSVTSARPTAGRPDEPENMTSSMAWPRSILALCSPRTQRMASDMLDLPEPLGPTTTVRPGSKAIWVLSAKDLKPLSVSDLRYTAAHTLLATPRRRHPHARSCLRPRGPGDRGRRAPPGTRTPSWRDRCRARPCDRPPGRPS